MRNIPGVYRCYTSNARQRIQSTPGLPPTRPQGLSQVDASFAGAGLLCVQTRLLLEAYELQLRATEIPYPLPPVHVTDPNFLQVSVAIREALACVLHYIAEAVARA